MTNPINVYSSINYNLGVDNPKMAADLTLTGTSALLGVGNSLSNKITANTGKDTLDGGTAGNDTLVGSSAGGDTFIIGHAGETITAYGTNNLVSSSISYTLGANLQNLTLTGTGAINGTGNTLANVINGNSLANTLNGGGGNDTLNGGGGNDTLIGGTGNNTYIINNSGVTITELTGGGTDTVQSSISYTLGANLENLTLTGTGAISGVGNSLTNVITATGANETLDGGSAGNDTLIGSSAGKDTFVIGHAGETITAYGTGNTVRSAISYTLGTNLQNLTLTGSGAISGVGNSLANVITANVAGDTLDGGTAGNDTLIGASAGGDTFVIGHAGETITAYGTGNTVRSSINYTLGTTLQNLTLTGTGLSGVGNSLANKMTATSANETLDGGSAGNDTLIGSSAGGDTFIIGHAGETITAYGTGNTVRSAVSYTLGNNLQNLTLTGSAALTATGNSLDNVILKANSGNDTLISGSGIETLQGGTGHCTFYLNNPKDVVLDSSGNIRTWSDAQYTIIKNYSEQSAAGAGQKVTASNNTMAILTADYANDTLIGGTGKNTFYANAANDSLVGGTGQNTFYISDLSDKISAKSGATNNVIMTSGSSITVQNNGYTMPDFVQSLIMPSNYAMYQTVVTGNASNDYIQGTDSGTAFYAGTGNDTLVGIANSTLYNPDGSILAYPGQYGANNDEYHFMIEDYPGYPTYVAKDIGQDYVTFNPNNEGQTFLTSNAGQTILPYIGIVESGNNIVMDFSDITGKTSSITYQEDPNKATTGHIINQYIMMDADAPASDGGANGSDAGYHLKDADIAKILKYEKDHNLTTMAQVKASQDAMNYIASQWETPGTF